MTFGINFLLLKMMDDLHRLVLAESKYGTQIAPSPITFEREALKDKNYSVVKHICVSAGATRKVYS
jgi:hypothetical protein